MKFKLQGASNCKSLKEKSCKISSEKSSEKSSSKKSCTEKISEKSY